MSHHSPLTVGVLALQGDFAEHIGIFHALGIPCREVRTLEDLSHADRLIIPGGESTVMARFLAMFGLDAAIKRRAGEGTLPIYGTCAGTIILSKKAKGKNAPQTLGLMDIDVERNAYGSQADSFERSLKVKGLKKLVEVSFIRAPAIQRIGNDVEILATDQGKPVLVRQGNMLAGTFHPEVRGQTAIHELFLKL